VGIAEGRVRRNGTTEEAFGPAGITRSQCQETQQVERSRGVRGQAERPFREITGLVGALQVVCAIAEQFIVGRLELLGGGPELGHIDDLPVVFLLHAGCPRRNSRSRLSDLSSCPPKVRSIALSRELFPVMIACVLVATKLPQPLPFSVRGRWCTTFMEFPSRPSSLGCV
jgi:hypothetical protein